MKKWSKKAKLPVAEMEIHPCPNCGQEFQGYYCPSCGQSVTEFDLPMGFVFYDFLGNFFSFDTRFFRTFHDLLLKPGFLTVEFFKGRRNRYAPPLKIFIFLSFILFLLLETATNRGLDAVLDKSVPGMESLIGDSVIENSTDSAGQPANTELAADLSDSVDAEVNLNGLDITLEGTNIKDALVSVARQLEEKLHTETDPGDREQLINMINILRSPKHLVAIVLQYLSWASFIMLPVFALFLKLFYLRRKVYYIRHLLFSVHVHSFMFLLLALVLAIALIAPGAASYSLWLLLFIPVYMYMALLRFYDQGRVKSFLKFLLLGMIYSFLLTGIVTFVLVSALIGSFA